MKYGFLDDEDRRTKTDEIIFFLLFFFWFTLDFIFSMKVEDFAWATADVYRAWFRPIKYLSALYIFLFRKYHLKDWLVIVLVAALLYFTARRSEVLHDLDTSYFDLFHAWLFIVMAKREYLDKTIKLTAILSFFYISAAAVLALSGVLVHLVYYRGTTARMALGFTHPNVFGFRVMIMILCYLWWRRGRSRWYDYAPTTIIVFFTWYFTRSRTSVLCVVIVIFAVFLKKTYEKLNNRIRTVFLKTIVWGTLTLNILLFLLGIVYMENPVVKLLNTALSERLKYANMAYLEFGFNWFGQKVFLGRPERMANGFPSDPVIVDNAYFHMFLRQGILVGIIVCTALFLCHLKAARRGNYLETIILAVLFLYGSSEHMVLWAMGNVFLLFLTELFSHDERDATLPKAGMEVAKSIFSNFLSSEKNKDHS